jgi:hypothetical protein
MRVATEAVELETQPLADNLTDRWPVVRVGWFALASHAGLMVDGAALRREYPE